MPTITLPKKFIEKRELVAIPRQEYEELLRLKRTREFAPTRSQKQTLLRAELNLQLGKTLSYNELVKKLGFID